MAGNNNVVIFGTEPITKERYPLQCDENGVLATSASVSIENVLDTKTILYSDLTPGSVKKIAIETLGVAPNAKDYLGTSDYNLQQSFDGTSSRIKVMTEGVRGLSDTNPNGLTAVNVKPTANKNALYTYDDTLNGKITSDTGVSAAIQVAVKNIVPISGSDYATPTPTYNPVYVDANGFITTNVLTTQHENIRLGFDYYKNMLTFLSNGNSVFTVPSTATNSLIPALNNDGWLFKNTTPANPTTGSLMWYNNGPYGANQFATQTDIVFNQLDVFYVIIQNYYPASQSKIEMNVYTKPTGSGDYSINFRSKFNHILSLSPAQYLATGQSYMLYHGQVNKLKLNDPEVPRIKYDYNSAGSLGPLGNTEIVSHIELLFTDLLGGTQFLCNIIEGGLFSTNGHLVNYYFDNDIRTKTDTDISHLTSQITFDLNGNLNTSSSITNNLRDRVVEIKSNQVTQDIKNLDALCCASAMYAKNTTAGTVTMLSQDINGNLNTGSVITNNTRDRVVEIKSNDVTQDIKNLNALCCASAMYAKNTTSGNVTMLSQDSSGNLNVNLASGSISVSSVNIKDSGGFELNAVSSTVPQLKTTLYDTGGTALTSSSVNSDVGLDVNVINTVGITNYSFTNLNNGTPIGTNNSSLNTASALYARVIDPFTQGVSLNILDSNTVSGSGLIGIRNSLYVNDIINNGFLEGFNDNGVKINSSGNTVKIDGANNTVKLSQTGVENGVKLVQNSSGANGAIVSNLSSRAVGEVGVLVGGVNYGRNLSSNQQELLTCFNSTTAMSASYVAQDTYIRNPTTSNTEIEGFPSLSSAIGLNMYVIPSKTRTFLFNAYTSNTGANAQIGSIGLNINWIDRNFGLANPRQISVMRSGTSSATLNLTMEYIDTAGNEQTIVVPAPLPTTPTFVITGVVNVNKWKTNASLTTNDTLNIMFGGGINFSYAGGNLNQTNNGLFTCPNNAIAWVQNVAFASSASDNLKIFKWDVNGVRSVHYGWQNASNFNSNATGEYGYGGYITAGETIGWGGETSTTFKVVHSNIVVRYL